ncbi:MAG: hypothetical protein ACXWB9_10915 [Flavisolibacter sp.]
MKLAERLVKLINRKYEPETMVKLRFGHQDIALRTDKEGNAVQMFIGREKGGVIRGDRYSRTMISDRSGQPLKDYWERKGKAS